MGKANHQDTKHSKLRTVCLLALTCAAAAAAVLEPEWSTPLGGTVRSATVRPRPDGTEELWLMFDDGRLAVAGLTDTLRPAGRAPAGAVALCACRDSGYLYFACGDEMVVRDTAGRELRRLALVGLPPVDSIWCVGTVAERCRFVLWCGPRVYSATPEQGRMAALRLDGGFAPLWAALIDVTGTGEAELVATDGCRLAAWRLDGTRSLNAVWCAGGGQHRAAGRVGPALLGRLDVEHDEVAEFVVLTDRDGDGAALYDSLRCLAGPTLEEVWRVGAGNEQLPGRLAAVAASDIRVFVLGFEDERGAYVARLDEGGIRRALRWLGPPALVRPLDVATIGRWPLVVARVNDGADVLRAYPPSLGSEPQSPGYSGVRIHRLFALRLDRDTFPDLLVIRTSADAGMRVDAFRNGLGELEAQLQQALAELNAVTRRGGDEFALARAVRRVGLLRQEMDPGSTQTAFEEEQRRRARQARRQRATAVAGLALAGAALLLIGGIGLARSLRRERDLPHAQQAENAPLPVRAALSADLVALDHNFVSKGNDAGAIERLIEVRERHGLARDRDLARVVDAYEPHYSGVIERLIEDAPTMPLVATIERAARAALQARPLEIVEMSRSAYLGLARREGFRIVLVRSREYPDALRRMRLPSSARVEGIIEHVVVDHMRYAGQHAEIVLDYTVNTQWNRKVFVQLLSDSGRRVDFARRSGHLVSELDELASQLRGVVEVPGPDYEPGEPGEKLWLRFTDLVAVLEETRARLRAAGAETE